MGWLPVKDYLKTCFVGNYWIFPISDLPPKMQDGAVCKSQNFPKVPFFRDMKSEVITQKSISRKIWVAEKFLKFPHCAYGSLFFGRNQMKQKGLSSNSKVKCTQCYVSKKTLLLLCLQQVLLKRGSKGGGANLAKTICYNGWGWLLFLWHQSVSGLFFILFP